MRGHAARKVGDADFFRCADVIDAEMLAFFTHHQDAGDEVVDEAEAARFLPAPLDFEPDRAGRLFLCCGVEAQGELGYHVLPSHIGPVDIVRAENEHALEIFAAEIYRHQLADQLAAAIGIARVQRVGDGEGCALVGRDFRRRLIDLGARRENEVADAILAASIDYIDHPAHADVEHQVGLAIKEFRAIDEGEMMHLVHPLHGFADRGGVANVSGDEFYVLLNFGQPAWRAARIIVEHAHAMAGVHQGFHKSGADEAAAAGDENTAHARTPFLAPACATSIHAPDWCERRAASISVCTR